MLIYNRPFALLDIGGKILRYHFTIKRQDFQALFDFFKKVSQMFHGFFTPLLLFCDQPPRMRHSYPQYPPTHAYAGVNRLLYTPILPIFDLILCTIFYFIHLFLGENCGQLKKQTSVWG